MAIFVIIGSMCVFLLIVTGVLAVFEWVAGLAVSATGFNTQINLD